ncbi:LacI family DNA-binding transcriptional regulator [Lentibacillus saliphilus]|uniref:LacI family DNA-binding transcriptional regulator n=1 Tax=Lentibacillus saliphilus TaxID=2737028 RepID=UPI001C3102A8|nr:LacI family DNA-binding transcriptional regulator [Lentibacillus saliphilus]
MNLTIKDIAKMAGVSPGTVSKIMNNTGSISEKTRKKVLQVIEDTGYRPTFSAKSLATKKSNLIGLIYAGKINVDFTHPFFNEVMTSFKKNIGELGYDMLMFSNEQFQQNSSSYLARCHHFQVDGCLIISGEEIEESVYELVKSDIPCVGVDLALDGPKFSYVMTDNKKISYKIVEHLHALRIQEIAFINGQKDSTVAKLRADGFYKAMKQFGLSINEKWIQHGDFFEDSGYKAMKKILSNSTIPKAVYAASDLMAFGAIKAIEEAGMSVPEDICVIGCDDIDACHFSSPSLTTVRQDKEKIGTLAARMLHDFIEGSEEENPIFVEPELIVRESCTPKI